MTAAHTNARGFSEPFFTRFARVPLGFEAEGRRLDYRFPTFFRTRAAIAGFLCSRARLDALIGARRVRTIDMLNGRSIVVFGCYEHLEVAEMGSYYEAFVCVPSFVDSPWPQPPLLPLVLGPRWFQGLGQLFLHMPVTSEDNRLRGVHLWGLPKTSGAIRCDIVGDLRVCRVESGGEHLFTLRIPTDGRATRIEEVNQLVGRERGAFTRAHAHVRGDFRVRKNLGALLGPRSARVPYLELGTSPAARALQALELHPTPLELRYCDAAETVLELPEGTLHRSTR